MDNFQYNNAQPAAEYVGNDLVPEEDEFLEDGNADGIDEYGEQDPNARQEEFENIEQEEAETDQAEAPEVNQEEELKKKIVLYYHQLVSLIASITLGVVLRVIGAVVRADAAEELLTADQRAVCRP